MELRERERKMLHEERDGEKEKKRLKEGEQLRKWKNSKGVLEKD